MRKQNLLKTSAVGLIVMLAAATSVYAEELEFQKGDLDLTDGGGEDPDSTYEITLLTNDPENPTPGRFVNLVDGVLYDWDGTNDPQPSDDSVELTSTSIPTCNGSSGGDLDSETGCMFVPESCSWTQEKPWYESPYAEEDFEWGICIPTRVYYNADGDTVIQFRPGLRSLTPANDEAQVGLWSYLVELQWFENGDPLPLDAEYNPYSVSDDIALEGCDVPAGAQAGEFYLGECVWDANDPAHPITVPSGYPHASSVTGFELTARLTLDGEPKNEGRVVFRCADCIAS